LKKSKKSFPILFQFLISRSHKKIQFMKLCFLRCCATRSICTSVIGLFLSGAAFSKDGVTIYTPYARISVPPGQSIDYPIDIINNSSELANVGILLSGFPKGWNYDLKSGGWAIGEISVLSGEKKSVTLHVEVPLKVNKGVYKFNIVTSGFGSLPLAIVVSEQGTFKTELTTRQPNMEGNANANFSFSTELKNSTGDRQLYALRANVPPGWNVSFKMQGRPVTSAQVEANHTENISVELDPPDGIMAGSYKIPIVAETGGTSASLELEVVVKGSFSMEVTTPTGLLSTNVTAGDEKRVELAVKNSGSAELRNIKLAYNGPINWDVVFDPKDIVKLEVGKTAQVFAIIKADKKAIPGDYLLNMEARNPEITSKVSFRVSVETSMFYGWIGVLIIGVAAGGVYYLFLRYGRR
jgi:uncharacterized membrane protein